MRELVSQMNSLRKLARRFQTPGHRENSQARRISSREWSSTSPRDKPGIRLLITLRMYCI